MIIYYFRVFFCFEFVTEHWISQLEVNYRHRNDLMTSVYFLLHLGFKEFVIIIQRHSWIMVWELSHWLRRFLRLLWLQAFGEVTKVFFSSHLKLLNPLGFSSIIFTFTYVLTSSNSFTSASTYYCALFTSAVLPPLLLLLPKLSAPSSEELDILYRVCWSWSSSVIPSS